MPEFVGSRQRPAGPSPWRLRRWGGALARVGIAFLWFAIVLALTARATEATRDIARREADHAVNRHELFCKDHSGRCPDPPKSDEEADDQGDPSTLADELQDDHQEADGDE